MLKKNSLQLVLCVVALISICVVGGGCATKTASNENDVINTETPTENKGEIVTTKEETTASAASSDVNATSEGDVAATVDGVKVLKSNLDNYVKMNTSNMGMKPSEDMMKQLREKILNQMIEEELLYHASKDMAKDVDQKAKDEYENIIKRYGSEEKFAEEVKKSNFTIDEVKEQIKRGLTVKSYIESEVISKIKISDEAIKAVYDAQPLEEQVKASHVLCKIPQGATQEQKDETLAKIKKVQERLNAGEKFEDVAKEISECPSGKNGGDLGYFTKGKMVKPFEDVAFSLEVGNVSDVVETQFGYHIIKVVDKKKAEKKPYDKEKARIENDLKRKEFQEKMEALLKELREKAKIEIMAN